MTRMIKTLLSAAIACGATLSTISSFAADPPPAAAAVKPAEDKPRIDVVFCIDCSGSMGGVIETAKQKVWAIVNETARAKPSPELRIGLIGYGNANGPFQIGRASVGKEWSGRWGTQRGTQSNRTDRQ